MKKTYIAPNAKSIELMFEGLIADSKGGGLDGGQTGRNYDPNAESYSNRRNSIWGDED